MDTIEENTIEFLAVWENMHNENFNSPEFEGIKKEAGLNRFNMSAKQWITKTSAIGIVASAGFFAHNEKDMGLISADLNYKN